MTTTHGPNFDRIIQAALSYEQGASTPDQFRLWLIQEIAGMESWDLLVLSSALTIELTTTDDLMVALD
jgi:hypothetical protein